MKRSLSDLVAKIFILVMMVGSFGGICAGLYDGQWYGPVGVVMFMTSLMALALLDGAVKTERRPPTGILQTGAQASGSSKEERKADMLATG